MGCVAHALLLQAVGSEWFTTSQLAVLVLVGGLLLLRKHLFMLVAVATLALLVEGVWLDPGTLRPGELVLFGVAGLMSMDLATSRQRLGLTGRNADSMLVELRDRLRTQGAIPPLPPGWHVEVLQVSADGGTFAGDFVVAAVPEGRDRLELAVVDVSGKGNDAGSRALLLSGAMGGLLGSVPPEFFLASANEYLLRQDWGEGFATAGHVAIDFATGEYLVDSAGHPPAAHFDAGSGRWRVSSVGGSVLGLFDEEKWPVERGRMRAGDAILLYTDGLIEIPGRDLGVGIDKMLGEANRLVITTFEGGTRRLLDAVAPRDYDDRAIVLIWRSHP